MAETIYNRLAEQYDAWYDMPRGGAIFTEELEALQPLFERSPGSGLEVGVGSGRFASALGIGVGIDPAIAALRLAARRGVKVVAARGEQLPFHDATFDVVLFVVTLCFVADPPAALSEARRVLRPGGRLVIGEIPADGPWGRYYQARAAAGHPYYRSAHFFTRAELGSLLADTGFRPTRVRSALYSPPEADVAVTGVREGDDPAAGFLAQLASLRAELLPGPGRQAARVRPPVGTPEPDRAAARRPSTPQLARSTTPPHVPCVSSAAPAGFVAPRRAVARRGPAWPGVARISVRGGSPRR